MAISFIEHFEILPDHRVMGRSDYPLIEIIFLSISAILSGFDGWESIEDFGHSKLDWLRKFLAYENGIPKHDTIARVMSCIPPKSLQESFVNWVQSIAAITDGEIIAIDGKTARCSYDKRSRKSAIHMVSAWASTNGIVLGQQKTQDKSNEITAIPKLLETLEIKECIVTIDAMGCQKEIAKAIQNKGADYVLALKKNHVNFNEMVTDFFSTAINNNFKDIAHDAHKTFEKSHGRIEHRYCYTVKLPDYLNEYCSEWHGLKSIVCIHSKREFDDKLEEEKRYYISSLEPDAKKHAGAIRSHWGIENSLHWVLDVTFKEDESRIRRGMAAENMSVMRHLAINMLKNDIENKESLPRKRRKALFYDEYREKLLISNEF